MTDLIEERTAPSAQAAAEKTGEWKENNTEDADAPTALPQKSRGVEEGTVPEPLSTKSSQIAPKKD